MKEMNSHLKKYGISFFHNKEKRFINPCKIRFSSYKPTEKKILESDDFKKGQILIHNLDDIDIKKQTN